MLNLLLVSLGATTAVLIESKVALAAPNCVPSKNTLYKAGNESRGNRADNMEIYNSAVDCGRVSSLLAECCTINPPLRGVEVGWYENPIGRYHCLNQTDGPPKKLAFAYIGDSDYCARNDLSLPNFDPHKFLVKDADQDGHWTFWFEAVQIWQSPDMGNLTTGWLRDNGERIGDDDSAAAEFRSLQRMNQNADWVDWSNTNYDANNSDDGKYKGCKYSDTHTAVKANTSDC